MQTRLVAVVLGMLGTVFVIMPDAAACDLRFPHCAAPTANSVNARTYSRPTAVRAPGAAAGLPATLA